MMKHSLLILALLLGACAPAPAPTTVPPTEAPTAVPIPLEATQVTAPTDAPVAQPPAETLPPLPAGPLTIVTLGDSLTQGDGDDSGRGYPGRLLDLINASRPGSDLVNLGQSGWSSDALINGDQGIESQLTRGVAAVNKAVSEGRGVIALVWIGSNDLWYLYEYGDGTDENDAADLSRYETNLDMILKGLTGAGARVAVALLDDQSRRPVALKGEAFTNISAEELQRMSAQVVRYNQVLKNKAAQYGAVTVDFYSSFIFTNPATLYDDGNHPNQAGYDIIAEMWFNALKPILGLQ